MTKVRYSGVALPFVVAFIPLAAIILWCVLLTMGSSLRAATSSIPSSRFVYLSISDEEIQEANRALLMARLDDWERRAQAKGEVRLTAREIRYLRRISQQVIPFKAGKQGYNTPTP